MNKLVGVKTIQNMGGYVSGFIRATVLICRLSLQWYFNGQLWLRGDVFSLFFFQDVGTCLKWLFKPICGYYLVWDDIFRNYLTILCSSKWYEYFVYAFMKFFFSFTTWTLTFLLLFVVKYDFSYKYYLK